MKNFQLNAVVSAFLLLSILGFSSCKDHDDDHKVDPDKAVITITNPTPGMEVKANQEVTITGSITSPETLHGYTIYIRKKADNSEVFKKEVHDHKKEITISQPWTVDAVTEHVDLELEVTAAVDHDGNLISKKVSFHAMP